MISEEAFSCCLKFKEFPRNLFLLTRRKFIKCIRAHMTTGTRTYKLNGGKIPEAATNEKTAAVCGKK